MKIYIVLFHDWQEVWSRPVRAFYTKEEAQRYTEELGGDYDVDGHYYMDTTELD